MSRQDAIALALVRMIRGDVRPCSAGVDLEEPPVEILQRKAKIFVLLAVGTSWSQTVINSEPGLGECFGAERPSQAQGHLQSVYTTCWPSMVVTSMVALSWIGSISILTSFLTSLMIDLFRMHESKNFSAYSYRASRKLVRVIGFTDKLQF